MDLIPTTSTSPHHHHHQIHNSSNHSTINNTSSSTLSSTASSGGGSGGGGGGQLSRYENQKRRDWNTFGQYLRNHRPPLTLARCSGAHVLEFLRYLDQFGKTKVHNPSCPYFGHPNPPAPCPCPLRQAWGSLDALIGRLRAAYEENGGAPEENPFGARAVRLYLREVRDSQAKARGVSYEKKKRKRPPLPPPPPPIQHHHRNHGETSGGGGGVGLTGLAMECFNGGEGGGAAAAAADGDHRNFR